MKKLLTGLLFGFIIYSSLNAQNELGFEFDFARFKYDNESVYMEFYYDLNPKNMKVIQSGTETVIEAIVHIEMKDIDADTFYINKSWKIQSIVGDSSNNGASKTLTGVFGFVVPEGDYALTVKAYDSRNEGLSKNINERVKIIPFMKGKYSVSDIQLATNIKRENVDTRSLFYKNTIEVIPNPSMFYSNKMPVAFFYFELYDLVLEDESSSFTLNKNLFNSAGASVYKQSKNINQGSTSLVEIGLINLSKFPTDSYNLVFSLVDSKTNQAYISAKRLFLYNPDVVDSTEIKRMAAGVMGSEFAILTKEECDDVFNQSKYIAVQNEIDAYTKIDSLNAKREFLYYFWKNRDVNPSTLQNEFKIDYMRRVEYTNRNFSVAGRPGYKTDRGRVYLTYGEPDQRDFYPNESNLKPHEIWFFNSIEGGVSFIFGDVTGFGNYELLHSTKRGEIIDESWQRRLATD